VVVTVRGAWLSVDLRHRAVDDAIEGLDFRLVEREPLPLLLAGPPEATPVHVGTVAGPVGLNAVAPRRRRHRPRPA
jgi:hypothetical protein